MGILSTYEPKEVLNFFEDICSIPHGSENIDQISNYLVNFAKKRDLKYRQDESGNVIIWKPGTEGYENSAPVIIQGHMDMVAVQEDGCRKNMMTEGLDLEILDGDWISAKGTSLGGDDGIAVAYALALLDSTTIPHPPLEVIVTTNEEIGMLGADVLDCEGINGRIFMNIDSEDEGIFTVSCAGGMTAISSIPYKTEEKSGTVLGVRLSGFAGGHSGTEINKGRLNANVVMGRVLNAVNTMGYPKMLLISVSGGDKDNAIAAFSEAEILVTDGSASLVESTIAAEISTINEEYKTIENGIKVAFSKEGQQTLKCMNRHSTDLILALLMNIPNGIQRMNPDMEGMVQTSLNLGILRTTEDSIVMTSALRSSSETEKKYLLSRVRSIVELVGGTVMESGDYPGWEYRADSLLRDTMVEAYREQYGEDPIVEGIHAGLECGIFSSKLPGLDCISYGPQMEDIHTTNEKLSISSTLRTWELTKATLAKLK